MPESTNVLMQMDSVPQLAQPMQIALPADAEMQRHAKKEDASPSSELNLISLLFSIA